MKNTKQLLGSRIKELRRNSGLSQDQLSEQIGIDPKSLSRIELGNSYPYVETLGAIAKALQNELKDLFDFSHLASDRVERRQSEEMLEGLNQDTLSLAYRIPVAQGGAMKSTKQLLGSRIKELRRNSGLSQDQLSEQIGIDPKSLSRIELGNSYPYVETLEAIAKALQIELKDLFDFSHLASDGVERRQIEEMLEGLDQDTLRLIYRIVRSIVK